MTIDNFYLCQRIGDVELGILTVCMQLDKALNERRQDQYFSNVVLKVNTKLGGVNHLVGVVFKVVLVLVSSWRL
jgi:Piwi domain